MDANFVEATSHNLPVIDSVMVMEYFTSNPDFADPEVKNVKTTKSTRHNYGDNAVGFVQLNRENNICTVRAVITPEHRVRQAGYKVEIKIDEEENIVQQCICLDCSASAGGCKHSIAFLLWVHRRSEEPSVTSVECYWRKPTLAKVGSSIKSITLSGLCDKPIPDLSGDAGFMEEVRLEASKIGASGTLFQAGLKPDACGQVCLHRLAMKYKQEDKDPSAENFIVFLKEQIKVDTCKQVVILTRDQHKCPKWYTVRYGRITASKLFEASRCTTSDGSLVKSILGGNRPIQTEAIKRGQALEKEVLKEFARAYEEKVESGGFFINPQFPIFGASPDGLTKTHVIEVKCPANEKTLENYMKEDSAAPKPYAQIQLQMFLTGRKFGYLVVAAPTFERSKHFYVLEVDYDENYVEDILNAAKNFWKSAVYPKL